MRRILYLLIVWPILASAQFNTDRLVMIGRSALYYEDYVLSIQYFNQAISAKPYLYEPWFLRGVAKYYLDDFAGAEHDPSHIFLPCQVQYPHHELANFFYEELRADGFCF